MTGSEIKELRERLGVSQEALARMIGCSHASVYNWERGTYKPTQMAQRRLAEIENRAAAALFGESKDEADARKAIVRIVKEAGE